MPFVLIKNNLKLMLRSKWILIIMIILPLFTILLLSSAFKELLNTAYNIDEFTVGYRISTDSIINSMLPELKKVCKTQKANLLEFPEGEIEALMKNKTVAVFVEVKKDNSYVIYRSSDKKNEASIINSILSDFFYQANEAATIAAYREGHDIAISEYENAVSVKHEALATDPVPTSTDYYGIIYIVYYAWCGMISLVAVISSERKNAIPRRMRASHTSKFSFYLGKLIPCTLATYLEVCAAWILSVLLLDIHWGNIGASAFLLFLISVGASSLGILLFQLFHNVAISIVLGFLITWVWGFFGGSFQTYMYADLPQKLVDMSPLYHINKTLVEFSTKGFSDNTVKAVISLLCIIAVSTILGILFMNRRLEEQ